MTETVYEYDADERLWKPRRRAVSYTDDGDHPLLHMNDGSDYRYDTIDQRGYLVGYDGREV